jgi:8-amino-7-oxononanoate synthase
MTSGRLSIAGSKGTAVTIGGRELVSFAGCDYLGLAHHPRVVDALRSGALEHGVSSAASRETTGNTLAHDELERDIALFLRVEAALLVSNGYLSNLVLAQALAQAVPNAVRDVESHVSIRDALAASRMHVETYAFADPAAARIAAAKLSGSRVAIFTDGVYPSRRRIAPLRELLELVRTNGFLVVDDCHGFGVLGASGRGSVEHCRIDDPRVVITGTLSKAFGCFGGFVAGTRAIVERARGSPAYVGSTPVPPALAIASSAAIRELEEHPERLQRLRASIERLRAAFLALKLPAPEDPIPVFAFTLGSRERNEAAYQCLFDAGLLVPHIHYPDGVGDRNGYFRVALNAEHTPLDIDRLAAALRDVIA